MSKSKDLVEKVLKRTKIVKLPIEVPVGDYCWEHGGNCVMCERFSNEGGYSTCDLGFDLKKRDEGGVRKPPECIKLKS